MTTYESPLRTVEFLPQSTAQHQQRSSKRQLCSSRKTSILLFVLAVLLVCIIYEFDSIKVGFTLDSDTIGFSIGVKSVPSPAPSQSDSKETAAGEDVISKKAEGKSANGGGFGFPNIFGGDKPNSKSPTLKPNLNSNPKDLERAHFIDQANRDGEKRVQRLLKWMKEYRDRRRKDGMAAQGSSAAVRATPHSITEPKKVSERWPHQIVAINAAELVNGSKEADFSYLDLDVLKGGFRSLANFDLPSQVVLAESPHYPFEVEMVKAGASALNEDNTTTTAQIVRPDRPRSILNGVELSSEDETDVEIARAAYAGDNFLYPSQRVRPEDADVVAIQGSIWWELITNYRNAPLNTIIDVSKPCACLLSAVTTGNCDFLFESLAQCVQRMGAEELDKSFPLQCTRTDYWKQIIDTNSVVVSDQQVGGEAPPTPSTAGRIINQQFNASGLSFPMKYSQITTAEICEIGDPFPQWIPPAKRTPAPHGEPRVCNNRAMQYPMTFGTPLKNIQKRILPKLFDFFPLPLDPKDRPVGYHDEDFAQAMASLSYYCISHARGGWDCGRHYEFLGAGCVPYLIDIHAMPRTVMTQMPVQLLREVVSQAATSSLGYVKGATGDEFHAFQNEHIRVDPKGWQRGRVHFSRQGDTAYSFDHNLHDEKKYWGLARRLLKYAQRFATTESMVSYVLETMGIAESVKKVFVYMPGGWDNMGMTVITGLNGLGIETVAVNIEDYPPMLCMANPLASSANSSANSDSREQQQQHKMSGISTRDLIGRRDEIRRGKQHGGSIPWGSRLSGDGKGLQQQKRKPEEVSGLINHQYLHGNFEAINENTISGALKTEMSKYDAVIFPFYRTLGQGYPYGVMMQIANAMPGKVAVISHDDSVGDPFEKSDEAANSIYFFSRELRRQRC